MPAILDIGKTNIRDAIRGVAGNAVTHVGISTASDAFAGNQTALDPTAGTNLIKAATFTVVTFDTLDATMSVNGTTEFTGLIIRTIGMLKGATRTDVISRSVRTVGLGIQAGDSFTIGVRYQVADNS